MIVCTQVGIEPSEECYDICVIAHRCEALKTWEQKEKRKERDMTKTEAIEILERRYLELSGGGEDEYAEKVNLANDIAIHAIESLGQIEDDWHYVHKDGNPTEIGTYYCMLVSPMNTRKGGGKVVPYIEYDNRWFANADESETAKEWRMCDQPDHGLVWTEQTGSSEGERVYAWRELPPTTVTIDTDIVQKMVDEALNKCM